MQNLSEQEIFRRENLSKLRALGIDPYPSAMFSINTTIDNIRQNYTSDNTTFEEVVVAGRMMSRRIMGKASFAEIQDSTGRMQVYLNRDKLCPNE